MSATPHLDHLRRYNRMPEIRYRERLVAFIPGATADDIGSSALQELANERRQMIAVEGPSKFHSEKLYRPKVTK